MVGIGGAIAIPLGLLAGIYLAEFDRPRRLAQLLRGAVLVLSGVPSIIAGVFAYGALVATGIVGFSAIAGSVALAVLMLPIIARFSETALHQVPQEQRWAAIALGASPTQVIAGIALPAAAPGLISGIMLAIARALGETAPLLFTALNSDYWPQGLLQPTPTLSVLIYNYATSPFPDQQQLAWAAALVLVLAVLLLNSLVHWIVYGQDRRQKT